MISPEYVRSMAAYNAEMNRRLYGAAARLSDDQRRQDRGAFWGSIHGTLNHLLWADLMWMSRFAGWDVPPVHMAGSPTMIEAFDALAAARADADRRLSDWAGTVQQAWLDGDLAWFSGAAQRQMSRPRGLLVTHLFNHQTHHRGQVHAMLTAAGEVPGGTDLFVIV